MSKPAKSPPGSAAGYGAAPTPREDDSSGGRGPRWGRRFALASVALFVLLLGYGLTRGVDGRIDDGLVRGEPVPAPPFALDVLYQPEQLGRAGKIFEAASADGSVTAAELQGVPYVLNFWASWCGPCRDEAPALEAGWKRDREGGVLYLGIDMQDLTDDAQAFIDEFSLSYPSIRDPGRDIANSYGVTGIPETFFIDADGQVVGHAVGVVDEGVLSEGVQAALESRVIGTIGAGDQRPAR